MRFKGCCFGGYFGWARVAPIRASFRWRVVNVGKKKHGFTTRKGRSSVAGRQSTDRQNSKIVTSCSFVRSEGSRRRDPGNLLYRSTALVTVIHRCPAPGKGKRNAISPVQFANQTVFVMTSEAIILYLMPCQPRTMPVTFSKEVQVFFVSVQEIGSCMPVRRKSVTDRLRSHKLVSVRSSPRLSTIRSIFQDIHRRCRQCVCSIFRAGESVIASLVWVGIAWPIKRSWRTLFASKRCQQHVCRRPFFGLCG